MPEHMICNQGGGVGFGANSDATRDVRSSESGHARSAALSRTQGGVPHLPSGFAVETMRAVIGDARLTRDIFI